MARPDFGPGGDGAGMGRGLGGRDGVDGLKVRSSTRTVTSESRLGGVARGMNAGHPMHVETRHPAPTVSSDVGGSELTG